MESELPEADAAETSFARTPPNTPAGFDRQALDSSPISGHTIKATLPRCCPPRKLSAHFGRGRTHATRPRRSRLVLANCQACIRAEQAARRFIRRIDACLDLKISALSCKKNAHRKTRYFVILLVPTKTDKDSALGIVYKPRGIQEIFASRLTG